MGSLVTCVFKYTSNEVRREGQIWSVLLRLLLWERFINNPMPHFFYRVEKAIIWNVGGNKPQLAASCSSSQFLLPSPVLLAPKGLYGRKGLWKRGKGMEWGNIPGNEIVPIFIDIFRYIILCCRTTREHPKSLEEAKRLVDSFRFLKHLYLGRNVTFERILESSIMSESKRVSLFLSPPVLYLTI